MQTCLSIAGSDCSGGAGIQADLKTFAAWGCYGMSVLTAVCAENTGGVISTWEAPPGCIRDQLDAVFTDIPPDAVKIGMLPSAAAARAAAEKLRQYGPQRVVTDPVMLAKDGSPLMGESALPVLVREILPLSLLTTPNLPEAEALTGRQIRTIADMQAAAEALYQLGAKNVLIKGGHLPGESAADLFFDGRSFETFTVQRIETKNTHGTGCTLSSAIAAGLARGLALREAVERAKAYVTEAIRYALPLGNGHGPTNHFYRNI